LETPREKNWRFRLKYVRKSQPVERHTEVVPKHRGILTKEQPGHSLAACLTPGAHRPPFVGGQLHSSESERIQAYDCDDRLTEGDRSPTTVRSTGVWCSVWPAR